MSLLRTDIALAQGRIDEALHMLHELDDTISTGTIPPVILADADAQRARILLRAGRMKEALRWVNTYRMRGDEQINEQLHTEHFFQHMTLAEPEVYIRTFADTCQAYPWQARCHQPRSGRATGTRTALALTT